MKTQTMAHLLVPPMIANAMAHLLPLSSPLSITLCFFAWLQAFLVVHGNTNNITNPSSLTPMNRDLYHSSGDLMEEIKALVFRHPDELTLDTMKSRNKGYSAEIAIVTYCRRRQETDDQPKLRILLSFGQHGRELITSELALRILSILSKEQFLPNLDPVSLDSTLDKLLIKVVPMENLNGRRLVEAGDLCERRNGRGVDPNRNWSVDWGKKREDYSFAFILFFYPRIMIHPGTAPFSEPETQIMRKVSMSFDPHIWINIHSGMEALFMPYDHKNTTPDGLSSHQMKSLLEELNQLHFQKRCMVGSGGGSVGYLAHGTATDFMFDIVKVPMAFTFEIYGDGAASSRDCFKMFNPTELGTFNRVLNEWSAAFFTIFKLGPEQLGENYSKSSVPTLLDKWVSIDEYLEGYLVERSSRYGKKMEVLELGMQEIRTYFRLFLLSSVLLMFMFCSRISKSKCARPIVSAIAI
nr:carboxypeptidase A2-like [Malus domestica]